MYERDIKRLRQINESITNSFKNVKIDKLHKVRLDKAIANLSIAAGRAAEIFRKSVQSIMQCQKQIMIPSMVVRSRQCKFNALESKKYCHMHDPSTEDKKEQIKIDRFMKKRNLNKAYLLAKNKNR